MNALAFAPSGKFLVAAIGQEHRLGRWDRVKAARNGVRIIPLRADTEESSGSSAAVGAKRKQQQARAGKAQAESSGSDSDE